MTRLIDLVVSVEDSPKMNRLYSHKTETELPESSDKGNNKENLIPRPLDKKLVTKSVTFKDILLGNNK